MIARIKIDKPDLLEEHGAWGDTSFSCQHGYLSSFLQSAGPSLVRGAMDINTDYHN